MAKFVSSGVQPEPARPCRVTAEDASRSQGEEVRTNVLLSSLPEQREK